MTGLRIELNPINGFKAFAIDNALTTEGNTYARVFKQNAVQKIRLGESCWRSIANLAQSLIHEVVSNPNQHLERIHIDKMVQSVDGYETSL